MCPGILGPCRAFCVEGETSEMKHLRLVSQKPAVAQNPNVQAKTDFKVDLSDQFVRFIFIKTD